MFSKLVAETTAKQSKNTVKKRKSVLNEPKLGKKSFICCQKYHPAKKKRNEGILFNFEK